MLSGNKIREIVIVSDSDKDKYYDSTTEDEEPRPPMRHYSTSQPPKSELDGCGEEGEERRVPADKHSRSTHKSQLSR
jgi:hypothetical protein